MGVITQFLINTKFTLLSPPNFQFNEYVGLQLVCKNYNQLWSSHTRVFASLSIFCDLKGKQCIVRARLTYQVKVNLNQLEMASISYDVSVFDAAVHGNQLLTFL